MAKVSNRKRTYDADSIRKMEGIEHIKAKPSMYIPDTGKNGLHHIAWEIVDNAVDEFLAGHCTRLVVVLDTKEQTVSVEDNGRGVPIEKHPQTGRPTVESIYTETLMGGKFGKQAYALSGGTHGVGAKATCALSDSMVVETCRDGQRYRVGFVRGAVAEKLKKVGRKGRKNKGTRVALHPDPEVFGRNRFDPDRFRERLTATAYLCPGLSISLIINGKESNLTSEEGLAGYLRTRLGRKEKAALDDPIVFRVWGAFKEGRWVPQKRRRPDSEALDVAMWWTNGDGERWYSWINMINVPDGGTHITGAKRAITRVLSDWCDEDGVSGDDFREGLRVAVHVMLKEPHFEGQAKNKLNNPECRGMADSTFAEHFGRWAEQNNSDVRMLVDRAIAMYKARRSYRAAKSIGTQTAYAAKSGRSGLPDKLTAALRCRPEERELFIVEGASAGGNAIQGRGKNGSGVLFQEVLGLKGKPPNPMRAKKMTQLARLFENEEYGAIIRAIGAGHDVTVPGESCDPSKSRVGKAIILADADADGGHIATLLLGFFVRFMLPLVEDGRLWVALPPLFSAKWPRGRVFGDTREEVLRAAHADGCRGTPLVTRLKGLGEMQPAELAETAINPDTRRLLRVVADRSSIEHLTQLLGSERSTRKSLLGLL